MNESAPMISVIMPSFNTPVEMLAKAVDSILEQTYRDFEFIIIDDCSTDASVEYLASLQDERVKVIRNLQNLGITKSLNVGLSHARGQYIARMDSDDICLPERLEKQLAFMENHPEAIVCGTWIQAFEDASYTTKRVIPEREYLQCSFLFGNAYGLCHPTAFFRGDMLRKHGIRYDENLPTAQDYGMWTTCAEYGEIANVEEVLFRYRVHNGQISVAKRQLQMQCALRVQATVLSRIMPEITDEQAQQHVQMCRDRKPTRRLATWVKTLKKANRKMSAYAPEVFDLAAEDFLKQKCMDYARVVKAPTQMLGLVFCCPGTIRSAVLKTLLTRMFRLRKRREEL